jgi:serine/threonine protein kinase
MVGSLNYAAPEQIEGRAVDGRADLYSLACVLDECLTGRPPFSGRSAAGILHAHLHEEPAPPSSLRPELPPAVDAVIGRGLRKRAEERYGSCRELAADLRSALAGGSVEPTIRRALEPIPPAPPSSRSTRPLAIAAAVVLVAAIAAAAAFVIGGNDSTTPPPSRSPSGPNAPLIRTGVQVTATHTAPSSTDAAGNVVTYLPGNVIDGDVRTAWRTPGNGRGESLTLLFDTPIQIVRIGLIPGYAKTDPETGVNRFEQNRIITQVRYVMPGSPSVTQTFRPAPVPQFVRVGATTSRITVEILGTTAPGGLDYTAISEIYVYGFPR